MTVHCVEIMASDDVEADKVKNKIADLKSKYGEKLPKENTSFSAVDNPASSTSYCFGRLRVKLSEKETEKNNLAEQIRKEVEKSASWWQIRWHACDNDEGQGSNCGWEYQNNSDNIPEEVEW